MEYESLFKRNTNYPTQYAIPSRSQENEKRIADRQRAKANAIAVRTRQQSSNIDKEVDDTSDDLARRVATLDNSFAEDCFPVRFLFLVYKDSFFVRVVVRVVFSAADHHGTVTGLLGSSRNSHTSIDFDSRLGS